MSKHIRPAAKRAGILKHVRWHVFRHSFATLLNGNSEDMKTVQESLRHADSKITLDTYTQGLMPVKRAAQRKVIEAIVPNRTHASADSQLQVFENKVGRVAQLAEQCPFKAWVDGSSPSALTI